jgi:hypothetical protein
MPIAGFVLLMCIDPLLSPVKQDAAISTVKRDAHRSTINALPPRNHDFNFADPHLDRGRQGRPSEKSAVQYALLSLFRPFYASSL